MAITRLIGSICRNLFIILISIFCCRFRHRILRMLNISPDGSSSANSVNETTPLQGVYVESSPTSNVLFYLFEKKK